MPIRIPGNRTRRDFRLFLRSVALSIGIFSAFVVSVWIQEQQYPTALYWYLLVVSAAVLEFIAADVLADRSFPYDTERKLALMENKLGVKAIETIASRLKETIDALKACDTSKVSATVHIVAELSSTADQRFRIGLLQLTDYVGPHGGKKGRITLITQGVIGRCARTGKIETVDFADTRDYLEAMVKEFGFTTEEALRHTKTGRSYLAYPLREREATIGVVYFFSTETQVFPRAANVPRIGDLAKEIVNYTKLAGIA